jgi:hypothetical protein
VNGIAQHQRFARSLVGGDLALTLAFLPLALQPSRVYLRLSAGETAHALDHGRKDDALADWAPAYYATNLDRRSQVKGRVDRGELFKFPQSIPPPPKG